MTTRRVNRDLLLVGSLPGDSTESVLRTCGPLFGDAVFALPDGETGERAMWTALEAYRLYEPHPDIEVVQPTSPAPGMPDYIPANWWRLIQMRIRPGVEAIAYARLPRIDAAIASYREFVALRDEGTVPNDVRFQVCLPFPGSAFGWFFRPAFEHDYPIHERAYEDAMRRELDRLLEHVPASDLAIQWDVCFEVLDLERLFTYTSHEHAWERFAGPTRRLSRDLPHDVLLGYHLCYGTFPEWPMREADDMGLIVRMANTAVETSGRPVDWLHLAGPRHLRSFDKDFFRPLEDLRPRAAKVFLGLIQPIDGVDGLERRVATARNYLADFGIALYCGFGREATGDPRETLEDHRRTADAFLSAPTRS